MKKKIIYLAVGLFIICSCRKEEDDTSKLLPEVSIETQNRYDDEAIKRFLKENYLDERGNIKPWKEDDTSIAGMKKLSDLNPQTLPSGVVYIIRPDAQPESDNPIRESDVISLMHNTVTYKAAVAIDGSVQFLQPVSFKNTIASGITDKDPSFFYVKKSVIEQYNSDKNTHKDRSFFEIQGFKEALTLFNSFDLDESDNYNLQGVIIVPSRLVFGKRVHFDYTGTSYKDRSFVFNFQVYSKKSRAEEGD